MSDKPFDDLEIVKGFFVDFGRILLNLNARKNEAMAQKLYLRAIFYHFFY